MDTKSTKPAGPEEPSTGSEPRDLPERWSAPRTTELVLRLLRGETLDAVSRDSHVPAPELEGWKRAFLEAGTQGLKRHVDPDDRELLRTRAKLGELMMRVELAEDLLEKRGLTDEWKRRKS